MPSILCLDDSETFRATIKEIIEAHGYEGRFVATWPEAFSAIGRSRPDLLLLDVNMPVLDGGKVGAVIRRYWKDLPIIVLSSESDETLEAVSRSVGANRWVRKKDVRSALAPTIQSVLAGGD